MRMIYRQAGCDQVLLHFHLAGASIQSVSEKNLCPRRSPRERFDQFVPSVESDDRRWLQESSSRVLVPQLNYRRSLFTVSGETAAASVTAGQSKQPESQQNAAGARRGDATLHAFRPLLHMTSRSLESSVGSQPREKTTLPRTDLSPEKKKEIIRTGDEEEEEEEEEEEDEEEEEEEEEEDDQGKVDLDLTADVGKHPSRREPGRFGSSSSLRRGQRMMPQYLGSTTGRAAHILPHNQTEFIVGERARDTLAP
ncbi:unnamed protein product [Pleuronectes platessa]|uniref:Uncharacterized protein n=1 Tax=Pleuronectes platessa TaxID=8262 RepID=A0A9N7UYZ0_PLEPL|nr:unnamed protein product [Pleuronectes platessa]